MILVFVQPFNPVKVIVVIPEETAVTSPKAFTVATDGSDEVQALAIAGAKELDSVVTIP